MDARARPRGDGTSRANEVDAYFRDVEVAEYQAESKAA
jgi:hypothetical protein